MGALWRHWRDQLADNGVAGPDMDAKLLTGAALDLDELGLAVHEANVVAPEQKRQVEALMQRRLAGEPVARILGRKGFYGLDFALGPATLVPRPETELLVDIALEAIGKKSVEILDLGTGTGCIPIAILANAPQARAIAVDLSADALLVAGQNATTHGVAGRLELLAGSWFEPLEPGRRFDLIVSNPPYIASKVIAALARDVREHDPMLALDGGPDGLVPYRVIVEEARQRLRPGGQLAVEIGYDQGAAVMALFAEAGLLSINRFCDLSGLDRVIVGHNNG
ncbi:peptide chain release factor N(5)-glutamine methyltransferase [Devosia rhodophyticola]|uniref:Release factor glutamine methyltransferase n=1 Tax=Devosia rhodophyticola TaxID=3026423 RepID=A0ABY7Z207_9HYPH|nr:peptide chain release factor N(5)-glutamine methyltransferase [Devosia rhodophyticola]WDR07517.1 peptide chain release factor N(5)-glutamine methyltransferase [Devosia rhodophyticola]